MMLDLKLTAEEKKNLYNYKSIASKRKAFLEKYTNSYAPYIAWELVECLICSQDNYWITCLSNGQIRAIGVIDEVHHEHLGDSLESGWKVKLTWAIASSTDTLDK